MSDPDTVVWVDAAGTAYSPLNMRRSMLHSARLCSRPVTTLIWTHISGENDHWPATIWAPWICSCESFFQRYRKPR